jgi:chitinase
MFRGALIGLCLSWTALAIAAEPPVRFVGYLPEYRLDKLDPAVGRTLDEVILFSIAPQAGVPLAHPQFTQESTRTLLAGWRKEQKVRVTVTLGGWNRSDGFPSIAATPESRRRFAIEADRFCTAQQLDGLDLDWEHPHDAAEQENYAALLVELKRVLGSQRTLSAAVAGWQRLPPAGWAALDAVHLMAYDGPERHATLEAAIHDVRRLRDQGVPAAKIRLGLPLYGRGIAPAAREQVLTYAQLVERHHPSAAVNEVDGIYFNGPDLIRTKLDFARLAGLGGVMFWEVGQDARGDASLLRIARAHVAASP